MVVTLRFQSTGSIPGNGEPATMRGPSLTIGRGDENDLVLPDPERMLSKRHCAIEDHNGNVVVVDFSTNGTFLNYNKLPLGATPTPLNNGDILSLGAYEVLVEITSADSSAVLTEPAAEAPLSQGRSDAALAAGDMLDSPGDGGDFLDELLGGRDDLLGPGSVRRDEPDEDGLLPPLNDDDERIFPSAEPEGGQGASIGMHNSAPSDHFPLPRGTTPTEAIPDDWEDDLLGSETAAQIGNPSDPFAASLPEKGAGSASFIPDDFNVENASSGRTFVDLDPEPAMPNPHRAPVSQPATQVRNTEGGGNEAARAFLKSLGAEDVHVSDDDLTTTLARMGNVLRIMIEGMREILMTRTSIKSEFRIEQTMIQAGGNNPLKFSISPEQAVEAMVRPRSKGYLDATEATQQALRDIKAHEVAMITGMEAALKEVLARLHPSVLEEKISGKGDLSGLLKGKKARYWEIYESQYSEISDQAENDFHELFTKEFARAYQAQLDKMK